MYLNTHTYYSFKYGTLSEEDLLATAKKSGLSECSLTDINSTAGCLNFIRLAPKFDIRPIVGIDFRNGARQQFVGIAKNNLGFQELNEYLSQHLHEKLDFPEQAPAFKEVYVVYPFTSTFNRTLHENEFLGVKPTDIFKLPRTPWIDQLDQLVILQTVSFEGGEANKIHFNMHRLLRSIDQNTLLSKLSKSEEGNPNDVMYPVGTLFEYYKDYPEIIVNTKKLLKNCSIEFQFQDPVNHQNLKVYGESETKDIEKITQLCNEGLPYRYGANPKQEILDRLKMELDLIKTKGFVSYFLINWDILCYARKKGYYYVGRGSGANSVVAYLLRITDVDPIDLNLYFERFINLFRQNPPDFDIDFSWKDRDDITRYIFERFGGNGQVALLATYSTFQNRAIIRELGKVFGLPPHEIEKVSQTAPQDLDHIGKLIHRYGQRLIDFPSHLSIHAGGVLIADKPIHYFTATSLPPKGYPVTHFDMIVAEDVGLFKFDILSQRGLGKIRDTLDVIKHNCPDDPEVDIHNFKSFKDDPKLNNKLRNADAIGCFYIESPAMRMLMKKLQIDEYLGLVAASSIIRPGVAKSGMMREYILRYRYPERRKEAHPILRDIMPDTYGVMVYQEDVIKVAHLFAKLDLGEADMLRRGMSGKYRSRDEFLKVKDKFFQNCKDLGHTYELSAEIWRQIESFAGYAFAKGHSASYAVESYQALYLKTYYPLEYMVAVVNNGGGFYRTEFYIHEARMCDAQIEAPCVNHSEALVVIYGKTIYLGMSMVKDLNHHTIEEILTEREKNGVFLDLDDFLDRVKISLEQIKLLVRVGALRVFGPKKDILWQVHFSLGDGVVKSKNGLFHVPIKQWTLPPLHHDNREDAFDEMDLLGFPLCSPFDLVELEHHGVLSKDLPKHENRRVEMYGYLVTIKNTGTSGGKRMNFGTFIDYEGQFIDTVHFPSSAARYPFRGRGIYRLIGKVVEEFDFYSLEVDKMEKINFINLEDESKGMIRAVSS
ncbi:DNA polymerase III, alpha subunit [Ekhidna lutea]|uniref:DNA-directed DNA polymerase n=2 Tax=Ekhidna lutea TaxID=447679 RepID=A0A239MDR6_EKHLU|nr:DNA polymerase III, alpha subunit [Ekhidna lutea]